MPAAVAAAVLLAGGCGGGGDQASTGEHTGSMKGMDHTTTAGPPAAAASVVTFAGTEYSFAPPAAKATVSQTTIRFTNKGAVEHDFKIDALKVHLVAQPGKTVEAPVTLKPGTYKTYCSVAGHSQSGMHGTLTVS